MQLAKQITALTNRMKGTGWKTTSNSTKNKTSSDVTTEADKEKGLTNSINNHDDKSSKGSEEDISPVAGQDEIHSLELLVT